MVVRRYRSLAPEVAVHVISVGHCAGIGAVSFDCAGCKPVNFVALLLDRRNGSFATDRTLVLMDKNHSSVPITSALYCESANAAASDTAGGRLQLQGAVTAICVFGHVPLHI